MKNGETLGEGRRLAMGKERVGGDYVLNENNIGIVRRCDGGSDGIIHLLNRTVDLAGSLNLRTIIFKLTPTSIGIRVIVALAGQPGYT